MDLAELSSSFLSDHIDYIMKGPPNRLLIEMDIGFGRFFMILWHTSRIWRDLGSSWLKSSFCWYLCRPPTFLYLFSRRSSYYKIKWQKDLKNWFCFISSVFLKFLIFKLSCIWSSWNEYMQCCHAMGSVASTEPLPKSNKK